MMVLDFNILYSLSIYILLKIYKFEHKRHNDWLSLNWALSLYGLNILVLMVEEIFINTIYFKNLFPVTFCIYYFCYCIIFSFTIAIVRHNGKQTSKEVKW